MKFDKPLYRILSILILAFAWAYFGFLPVKSKIVRVEGELLEADIKLAQYLKLAPQIPLWQSRTAELGQSAIQLVSNLYSPDLADRFLKDLIALAEREGLKVLDAKPTFPELLNSVRDMDSTSANLVRPVSFTIKVEGGYAVIYGLTEKISGLPAYRGFTLGEVGRGERSGTVDATLSFYCYLIINPKAGA